VKRLTEPFDQPLGLTLGCCGGDDAPNSGDSPKPPAAWSYSGDTGPEHWADLDPCYAAARTGTHQSPIDLTGPFDLGVATVFFTYQTARLSITNNGHSIQEDCPSGSSITVGGRRYELKQFHFHTPSEHTVDGGFYEMELHLVHQSDDGRLAVVGVFLTIGDEHPSLCTLWDHMPLEPGQTETADLMIDPSDLLPADRRCVQYEGSLTTPPCTENVAWIVLLEPIQVSAQQVEKFERVIGVNNRPIQPRNDCFLRGGR
jgi:carbonic anhydrase